MQSQESPGRVGGSPIDAIGRALVSASDEVRSAPLALRLGAAVGLLVVVGTIDTVTRAEYSLSEFYLLPVLTAAALVSRRAGRLFAFLGVLTWIASDFASGVTPSSPWVVVWNGLSRLTLFLIVNEVFGALRDAHRRERAFARLDTVTGIANARVFGERVSLAIAQCIRAGTPFTLAYADLDGFKAVNDRLGHFEGDEVLRAVAGVLQRSVREVDLAARLGGDEFGIVLAEADAEGARESLDRIFEALADDVGARWGVGLTIGAVTFLSPPSSPDEAVHLADDLMYRGKQAGRNRLLLETWGRPPSPSAVAAQAL